MATTQILYIGTYTKRTAYDGGILVCDYNAETGDITPRTAGRDTDNPSWVAVHPQYRILYAVSESGSPEGGAIHCYTREPATGELTFAGGVPSGGRGPCYVSVSSDGRFVFVANYNSGTVSSYRVAERGRTAASGLLSGPICTIEHVGSSVNQARQTAPHAHQAYPDPSGRYLLVPDLGTDKLMVYEVDATAATLEATGLTITVEAGSGPRHIAFHPDGTFLYLVNELSSTVMGIRWPGAAGGPSVNTPGATSATPGPREAGVAAAPAVVQTISTLPKDFAGENTTAAIRVHPSGRFLYASNRGHDSVAIFGITDDHRLEPVGWESTRGKTPREVNLSPDGRYLFAANQYSNNIATFAVDQETGALSFVRMTEAPRPVCLCFA